MEEVGGRDSDGVGGPELEAWVVLFDVEDKRSRGLLYERMEALVGPQSKAAEHF